MHCCESGPVVVDLDVIVNRGVVVLSVDPLHMGIRCHVLLGRELLLGRGFLDRLRFLRRLCLRVFLFRLYAGCERKGTAYQYCNEFYHSRSSVGLFSFVLRRCFGC